MQLPLTSLVPTVIKLISFWEKHYPDVSWYPYWYLGVPFRYVSGPIIPIFFTFLHKIFPTTSLTSLYISVIVILWGLGSGGVWLLVKSLDGGKWQRLMAMLLYFFLPLHIFLFSFGNGLHHIGMAFVPWALWGIVESLKNWRLKNIFFVLVVSTLILLIDVSSLLALVVGYSVLVLIEGKSKLVVNGVRAVLVVLAALSIATIWYGPGLWWTILKNPSLGGKPLITILSWLFQLLQALVPVMLAWWMTQKKYGLSSKLIRFVVFWGLAFGGLTLFRLLSDIDFWRDWLSYGLQLQLFLALFLSWLSSKFNAKTYSVIYIRILIGILLLTIINGALFLLVYRERSSLSQYRRDIVQLLAGSGDQKRVFVSGSPVFWLGSTRPLAQVRGGRDEVSVHPLWAMGAYQIREGSEVELLAAWLKILGVSAVVTHDPLTSTEVFKDYKNLERFAHLKVANQIAGNFLYEVENPQAWVADKAILNVPPPISGNDQVSISKYIKLLKYPVTIKPNKPHSILLEQIQSIQKDEILILNAAYARGWEALDSKVLVGHDQWGNITVDTKGAATAHLRYQSPLFGRIVILLISLMLLMLLFTIEKLMPYVTSRASLAAAEDVDEEVSY